MPSLPYTRDRPIGNQTPAQQRNDMLLNTNSTDDIVNVDMLGFSNVNAGQHKYISIPSDPSFLTPTTPTAQAGALYAANNGSARANLFFQNSQSTFPLSFVKAWGAMNASGGIIQAYGISGYTWATGTYTVNFSPALPSDSYGIIAMAANTQSGQFINYARNGTSSFRLFHTNTSSQVEFTVIVLQV
jgi:hypothetical protein